MKVRSFVINIKELMIMKLGPNKKKKLDKDEDWEDNDWDDEDDDDWKDEDEEDDSYDEDKN
jgi:hypothetical protein